MRKVHWLDAAKKNGWLLREHSGPNVRLHCRFIGCPGCIERVPDELGPVPEPCALPHVDKWGRSTYQQYVKLVIELKRRRNALGLSQQAVNAASGLADGHISKLEALHRTAQFDTLVIWAATLGLGISLEPCDLPEVTVKELGAAHTDAERYGEQR